MFRPSTFHEIVSGRRRGLAADALRALLRVVETPYTWAVTRRNRSFDRDPSGVTKVDARVVAVGNITLGGTGKTPVVAHLARRLKEIGVPAAIVSRGYGSKDGRPNDEALELERLAPGTPHFQDAKRVSAAEQAIRETGCRAIIADDAFQHRYLARDLDIVLLDALAPFGYEHVFPRGSLREPLEGLARADVVLLSRADLVSDDERSAIRDRVASLAPNALWAEVAHAPTVLISDDGAQRPIDSLDGQRIVAFCGLGNPRGFHRSLKDCGVDCVAFHEFPDHHAYSNGDVEMLDRLAMEHGADAFVCTLKDLVKVRRTAIGDRPLHALGVTIRFLHGEDAFERLLAERLGVDAS